ncbi:uncharacterized protein LOC108910736 [Anoplophora glabripennis]|uniref:uncharacterized protein LOC108910736 n=1 Tax=Anoplophora glabripennis TaxID=217634 RepID=UPI000C785C6B|nr:uncharacterized protein LOC108910736 [Anoplophora glabripennis]
MNYMKTPTTPEERQKVIKKFEMKWNFPKCLGAIDGKHILVQAPHNSGSYFFNYKGQHSTVLIAVVDAEYKFLITAVGVTLHQKYWKRHTFLDGNTYSYIFVANDTFALRHMYNETISIQQ